MEQHNNMKHHEPIDEQVLRQWRETARDRAIAAVDVRPSIFLAIAERERKHARFRLLIGSAELAASIAAVAAVYLSLTNMTDPLVMIAAVAAGGG